MSRVARRNPNAVISLASLALLLLLSASPTAGAQLGHAGSDQFGATAPATQTSKTTPTQRLQSLWTTVTVTLLLLLAFLVGTFVILRVGRAMVRRPRRRAATDYVDAWAGYRLTDEDVERATGEAARDDPDEPPDQNLDEQG